MPRIARKNESTKKPLAKPCELPDNDDTNCLICPAFHECQMAAIGDMKAEKKLDDDY